MSFRCNDCGKTITKVQNIRDCGQCQSHGRATSIPARHDDSDWITPAIIGYMIGSSGTHASTFEPSTPSEPTFSGGGGESAGGGASGSFDAPDTSSDSSSSDSSSDSGSSDSGSSDSGSSDSGSSDSGSSSSDS